MHNQQLSRDKKLCVCVPIWGSQVMKDGRGNMGLVDFSCLEDMQTALRKLDNSEFRNPFDKCTIRVREDRAGNGGGGGRGRSRSRSRSPRSRSRQVAGPCGVGRLSLL